ncbi:unnamed protein product [Effrenium voratum]|uniref:J domain-containing protein n=1 Tax=Effrenium voratum TaxID=2562239 RepID=A0AA36NAM4_9DINO|nr:unnamed protein product [Effrenium voratum]
MVDEETVLETPPPRESKRAKDPQSAAPEQRAPKRGRKSRDAEELASNATKLESEAEGMSQEAIAAEKAAVEAMERAQSLHAKAVAVAKQAEIAKVAAQEARQKAERAELSTTKEGRDALKAQDKADKQAAKEAEKARKQADKEEAAEARSVIKKIGDDIKASMVICKRAGMWEVPPGSVSFKNVKFAIFKELFSRGRCNFSPSNFCKSDASIVVMFKDAASIFGATKVRGGSMYATFVISSLRANYIPATGQLNISYSTDMGVATHRWGYACCLLCEKDSDCGKVAALESGAGEGAAPSASGEPAAVAEVQEDPGEAAPFRGSAEVERILGTEVSRPFQVLGLPTLGATSYAVRTAFRRLALLVHPDKNPGDEETL